MRLGGGGLVGGCGFHYSGRTSLLQSAVVFVLPLVLLPGTTKATSAVSRRGGVQLGATTFLTVGGDGGSSSGGRSRLRRGARATLLGEHGGSAAGGLLEFVSKAKRLANSVGKSADDTLQEQVLLRMSQEQVSLLSRLSQLDGELSRLLEAAKSDLVLANESDTVLTNITDRTEAATLETQETSTIINATNSSQQEVYKQTELTAHAEASMKAQVMNAMANEAEASSASSVEQQVDDNRRILERVGPRLTKIKRRLVAIEARLQHNNISEVVEDATKRAMSDVFRDMNRGLYRQLPD
mmetsp:Transcript_3199/g.7675  ORF Transcript_3199/g.7675 Transcript_3199/m.7675 type:complete len:297 (-) Transcript_3199:43-933(-)